MDRIAEAIGRIGPRDTAAMAAARARLDALAKPPGSLGRIEELAVALAGIAGTPRPSVARKAVLLCAADHGVAAEGVTPYPSPVTAQMVRTFVEGRAAINVLARRAGARVVVADVGVAADLPPLLGLVSCKVARGSANLARGPALTREQAVAAIHAGMELLETEAGRGLDLVATGEMGIGNTTPSSAIVAALTGAPAADVTGRGSGVDDAMLAHKRRVVEQGLAVNCPDPADPLDVLAKVGGLEIAALVGVILAAAARRIPVLLDGFIAGAAALVAATLCPTLRDCLLAAHRSAELGHGLVLAHLGLTPLLELDLRLGEGTGAALAMPLLDAACAVLIEMATLAEVGETTAQAAYDTIRIRAG